MHPDMVLAKLIAIAEAAPGVFHAVLEAPLLAQKALPGQFIMIKAGAATDPLLRRPLSLCGAGRDTVELLFQIKGKGTQSMAAWEPGAEVDIMGPLGNGFSVPSGLQTACLVAGGIGVAPLVFLASYIRSAYPASAVKIFMGGRTKKDVSLLERFNLSGCDIRCATEDGSLGFHGLVTGLFSDYAEKELLPGKASFSIFSCGPHLLLKALAGFAALHGCPCQVSLEAHMACGVGACLGCAAGAQDGGYKRVCVDGPVFDSREIDFSRQ